MDWLISIVDNISVKISHEISFKTCETNFLFISFLMMICLEYSDLFIHIQLILGFDLIYFFHLYQLFIFMQLELSTIISIAIICFKVIVFIVSWKKIIDSKTKSIRHQRFKWLFFEWLTRFSTMKIEMNGVLKHLKGFYITNKTFLMKQHFIRLTRHRYRYFACILWLFMESSISDWQNIPYYIQYYVRNLHSYFNRCFNLNSMSKVSRSKKKLTSTD